VATDGTEIKQYRKEWESNANGALERAMAEFTDQPLISNDIDDIDDEYVTEDENVE
jgi:hypothetical protein